MDLINYIAGPPLVGVIFLIVGVIMQRFPPKKINGLYGYRTNSSMKNQQTWDEANRYSARLMVIMGIGVCAFGVILTIMLNVLAVSAKIQSVILGVGSITLAISTAILLLVVTERHLKKTFNKQDEVR